MVENPLENWEEASSINRLDLKKIKMYFGAGEKEFSSLTRIHSSEGY
jgi:hypothetical protein